MIRIGNIKIGTNNPCFIIAEAGVNHNGDINLAMKLIDIASDVGADAIKFQTYKTEQLITENAPKALYQKERTGSEESQFNLLKKLELSYNDFEKIYQYCKKKGILFLSTPFDYESLDFLISLGIRAIKIPSGEITNYPFLSKAARYNLPIILSTGMSTLGEVETAIRIINEEKNHEVMLLHCVSAYPADPSCINLKAINTMKNAFQVPVGFSDHTKGIDITLAAAALGASIIEKHFTINQLLPGPDHNASLNPIELKNLITGIRNIEKALGDGIKRPMMCEKDTADVARKSIVIASSIPAGTILSQKHIIIKRPGTGLHPCMIEYIIGKKTRYDIDEGTILTLEMIE